MVQMVVVVMVMAILYPARFLPLWLLWMVVLRTPSLTLDHDGSRSSEKLRRDCGNGDGGGAGDADPQVQMHY